MTDGAMLTAILAALEIPCDKYSFHGKLKTLAAGLDIQTDGRLLGDVLDDIAANQGLTRDSRLYGEFIRSLYDYVTSGEDVTLSGNPLVLANALPKPLKECNVSWNPTQEGSGDPSPENIRPIKGRDSVKVTRCGENLLPFGERIEGIYQQQIMASDAVAFLSKACAEQEITLTFSVETQNIVFNDDVEDEWRKRIGFECHGTLADGTEVYTLQCWIDDRDGELTKNGKKTKTVTVTMPELVSGDITFYAQNIVSGSFVAYDFGIYVGTTAPTTYAPYTGQTVTLTLPHTIYGGEVDVQTGEGSENAKVITVDGTKLKFSSNTDDFWNLPHFTAPGCLKSGMICNSHFITNKFSINVTYEFIFTRQNKMTGLFASVDELNAYCAAQYAAGTPVQIAYKLANPVPFTATGGGAVKALQGTNTLLTDGDTVTATYRCNVKAAETEIDELYTDLLKEVEEYP